ncbi:MAG: molybdate ABC transporter substrate-binding protein [Sphingomonadales bacterium]
MILCHTITGGALAADVQVAVASNFMLPLQNLGAQFEARTGDRLLISPGSTGGLYAQIVNGAPFDVLLAADAERPRLLVREELAVAGSRSTYARGRVVLYSADGAGAHDAGSDAGCLARLNALAFKRLAIANPKIAPYGIAARDILRKLGLWKDLRHNLVRGENIAQTFQWVESGNASLGLVALSQVVLKGQGKGCRWIVPETYHKPLEQQLVLLAAGEDNPAAHRFIAFVLSQKTKAEIRRMGYLVD